MRHCNRIIALLTVAGTLVTGAAALAQGSSLFGYTPPKRGAPSSASRVGGGTRGPAEDAIALTALAPAHVGHTVNSQPALYWFIAEPIADPVEMVIVDQSGENALLDISLEPPFEPGIHAVSLAENGVALAPEVTYQWFVALVRDPDRRSLDVISGGDILLVEAPTDLAASGGSSDALARARTYAQAGLWYDTIESVNAAVAERPDDAALRAQRAALLDEVGLSDAAAYDRR